MDMSRIKQSGQRRQVLPPIKMGNIDQDMHRNIYLCLKVIVRFHHLIK